MLLNKQYITEEIEEEIKKCLQTKENENMTIHTQHSSKFIVIQAYLRKQEKLQINNPTHT